MTSSFFRAAKSLIPVLFLYAGAWAQSVCFTEVDNIVPSNSTYAALADFNHDGNLDVALIGSGHLNVLLGNGDGTFHPQAGLQYSGVTAIAAGDFNNDGNPDIAFGFVRNPQHPIIGVDVLLGQGDGTFQPAMEQTPNFVSRYAWLARPTVQSIAY